MPYVSCMYAPPDPTGMMGAETKQGENARIVCTDDNDPPQLWWLSEDSQVGDWLRYKEEGGAVLAYNEAAFAALSQPPEE
jgi:hypothetical protein